jgi:hypothetical protein
MNDSQNDITQQTKMKTWLVFGLIPVVFGLFQYGLALLQATPINWMNIILLVVGMYGGFGLLTADAAWLHQYYAKPNSPTSYITRSALFVLLLFPLTLFMLTSTGSSTGTGLLLGILIGLALEMFTLRLAPDEFKSRFLLQVKRNFSAEEIQWLAMIFCAFSVIVSLTILI